MVPGEELERQQDGRRDWLALEDMLEGALEDALEDALEGALEDALEDALEGVLEEA